MRDSKRFTTAIHNVDPFFDHGRGIAVDSNSRQQRPLAVRVPGLLSSAGL